MCSDYIGCADLGTGPTGVRWPYARAPALIPFTARDLAPNTARWYKVRCCMYVRVNVVWKSGDRD